MFLLQLRNELWKLYGKKRTYIGFGAFLVVQNAMLIFFHSKLQKEATKILAGNGYLAEQFISALTVALVMLIPQILLLMPLYVTLTGGEMIAKEAEDGTLRMILCRPIGRLRLLIIKWIAGLIFCISLVVVLGATALLFARIWFPWGGLFVFSPDPNLDLFNVLSASEGFRLYLWAHLFLILNACTMLTMAFMFSCFNMKPAAAMILALSFMFINLALESIPYLEQYHPWFLTYHFRSWVMVFANPIPWNRLGESICVLIGCNLTVFIIGAAALQVRDIKS